MTVSTNNYTDLWVNPTAPYGGNNIGLLTLEGDDPDLAWLAHTYSRRFDDGCCICGCQREHADAKVLHNDCVEGFKNRLQLFGPQMAETWSEWLDAEHILGDDEECYWELADLRWLFIDLWRAENRGTIEDVLTRGSKGARRLLGVAFTASVEELLERFDPTGPVESWTVAEANDEVAD